MAQSASDRLLVQYETEYFSRIRGYIEIGVKLFGDNHVSLEKGKKNWLPKKRILEGFFNTHNLILTGFPNGYEIWTENLPKILKKSCILQIPKIDENQSVQGWEKIKYCSGNNYFENKWESPLKELWKQKFPERILISEIAEYINDHWNVI